MSIYTDYTYFYFLLYLFKCMLLLVILSTILTQLEFAANLSRDVVNALPQNFSTGVYYGWAQVEKLPVEMMVMSIGWNPFYQNIEKSMVS